MISVVIPAYKNPDEVDQLLASISERCRDGMPFGVIMAQTFVHAGLFFTHSIRYSTPIRPLLMLFAALAIAAAARRWRGARA